jgi:hypothetical protein
VFNSTGDTFAGGSPFAINDTWAYQSEILYYDYKTDRNFKGTLKVTLYDDFGLDKPDVEKKFGYLRGFAPGLYYSTTAVISLLLL